MISASVQRYTFFVFHPKLCFRFPTIEKRKRNKWIAKGAKTFQDNQTKIRAMGSKLIKTGKKTLRKGFPYKRKGSVFVRISSPYIRKAFPLSFIRTFKIFKKVGKFLCDKYFLIFFRKYVMKIL